MVSKKYVGDYRLENIKDRKGRLKTVPVYRGPLFRFQADAETLKKAKLRFLVLNVIAAAALLITLLLKSELLQRVYVIMPLILSLLPMVLLWSGLYHLFSAGASVRRDQSDRIHHRFAGWSVVLLALSVLSLSGQIAAYASGSSADGIPVTVCTIVLIVCAALIFAGKDSLQMEEIPSSDSHSH